jgi:hypothetical protein
VICSMTTSACVELHTVHVVCMCAAHTAADMFNMLQVAAYVVALPLLSSHHGALLTLALPCAAAAIGIPQTAAVSCAPGSGFNAAANTCTHAVLVLPPRVVRRPASPAKLAGWLPLGPPAAHSARQAPSPALMGHHVSTAKLAG